MASNSDFFQQLLGLSIKPEEMGVVQMSARAVLVYIVLVAIIRLGKKRSLGKATAFDAVLIIIIGSVAARAITGSAPLLPSMAAELLLVGLHWLISAGAMRLPWLSRLVKGTSTVLIVDGEVDRAALARSHIADDDLGEDLRQKGVTVQQVKEARLERSGRLSVLRRS